MTYPEFYQAWHKHKNSAILMQRNSYKTEINAFKILRSHLKMTFAISLQFATANWLKTSR
ncbi:MAG: hypothetical protein AAF630_08385 [Cyanobacteria bacterium P01_C01_bin.38]